MSFRLSVGRSGVYTRGEKIAASGETRNASAGNSWETHLAGAYRSPGTEHQQGTASEA